METFDAIIGRVSVRDYSGKQVPKELLERLVDAGRRAPTARKLEPWEFIVVTEKGVLEEIGTIADHGTFIKDAGACMAIYCDDVKYYLEDGCAATENVLLAAADQGLGACWVAGDKKEYAPRISTLLGVPADMKLVSLISLGWPNDAKPQTRQRGLVEVLHWEKFRKGRENESI